MVAISAAAASTAQAAPEFYHCAFVGGSHTMYEAGCLKILGGGGYNRVSLAVAEKMTFSSKIGASVLAGVETIKCTGGSSSGSIVGPTGVEKVVVVLTGCTDPKGAGCKVNTPSAAAGEIVTAKLKGKLGAVAEAEAKSKAGVSLEPETSGSREYTTVEGSCLLGGEPVPVRFKTTTSRIIGEITPVDVFSTTGELIFKKSGSGQAIKTFEGAGETNNTLEAGGSQLSVESLSNTLTLAEMLEVLW
ncbi:MAG TPA: hypothetical protein VGL57_00600 [Solirubrobacteraceae bacterium]